MHDVLFYDYVDDYLERRDAFRDATSPRRTKLCTEGVEDGRSIYRTALGRGAGLRRRRRRRYRKFCQQ